MNKAEIITLRLSKEDKDRVKAMARKCNLSVSDLMRRSVINKKIPDPSHGEAIGALYSANADLARLGNLLKLGIDEGTFSEERVENLLGDIRTSQEKVKEIALGFGGTLSKERTPPGDTSKQPSIAI